MSNEDSPSIAEIQKALQALREQNREVSTDNRILREQIRYTELRTQNLRDEYTEKKNEIDNLNEKMKRQLEITNSEKISQRKERKKNLQREIKNKTNENNQIQDQIRNLQQQIVHFKRMSETLPKPGTMNKKTLSKSKTQK